MNAEARPGGTGTGDEQVGWAADTKVTPKLDLPAVLARLRLVKESSSSPGTFYAACPVHDDHSPSLTVTTGTSGAVIAYCHRCEAGASREQRTAWFTDFMRVVSGARPVDVERWNTYSAKPKVDARTWTFIRAHIYCDDTGAPILQKSRYDLLDTSTGEITKAFIWRHNEATGRQRIPVWVAGGSDNPPLYVGGDGQGNQDALYLTEGEKDADTLAGLGLYAFSSPHGAGTPLAEKHLEQLADLVGSTATITVVADNDPAGLAHARAVHDQLVRAGLPVTKVLIPPQPHNDATDAIDAGLGITDFTELDVKGPATVMEDLNERFGRRVRLESLAGLRLRPVRWLWDDRLALGSLALLGGREGIGKSTVAYWLAAGITRGELPGESFGKPRAVIVAATEDSWEHTIVPRLIAAGADLDLVYRVDVITSEDTDASLSLPLDNRRLEQAVAEVGAALILLDPLMSRLADNLDTHKDAEVRRALGAARPTSPTGPAPSSSA